MKQIFFTVFAFAMLAIAGCKSDKCSTLVCQNGGSCVDGSCKCTGGYSGTNCQTPPVGNCDTAHCLNGATCTDGNCKCDDGYTGYNCATQMKPARIKLLKLEVTRFSSRDSSGALWDDTTGPDLLPIVYEDTVVIWKSYNTLLDAPQGSTYDFTPQSDVWLYPDHVYTIKLFDYDYPNGNALMGTVTFTPYTDGNHFPQGINVDMGGPCAFTVIFEYPWQ